MRFKTLIKLLLN